MLEFKHILEFSQATLIKSIHYKKLKKTTRIWCHFQNKPYKTTSRFLQDITIPGEHHTQGKQNQNGKRIEKKQIFFILCLNTLENPFLCFFLTTLPLNTSSPQLQPRHHNIDNFLRHHIIVNIFPWNKLCQKPFHANPSLLFLISSLKSISTFKTKNL